MYCRYVLAFSGLMSRMLYGFHYPTPRKPGVGDEAIFSFLQACSQRCELIIP